MAHTKGPFELRHLGLVERDGIGKRVIGTVDRLAIIARDDVASWQQIDNARLFHAAPDLLDALHAMTANTKAETPEAIAAFDLAERAIAKAEPGPRGWTHAETSAPDDPTQLALLAAQDELSRIADSDPESVDGEVMATITAAIEGRRQNAAQAVERHIADAQQDMPLPDLLAAILRRAERARSYGRLMLSTKDSCIDDVIRLATRALLQVNDQVRP